MHGLQFSTYIGNIDKDIHHPTCFEWPNFHLTVTCKLILFMDIYTLNLFNMWLQSCFNFSLSCYNSCSSQCKWFGYLLLLGPHIVAHYWWQWNDEKIELLILWSIWMTSHATWIQFNFQKKIKLNSTILNWSQIQQILNWIEEKCNQIGASNVLKICSSFSSSMTMVLNKRQLWKKKNFCIPFQSKWILNQNLFWYDKTY